MRRSRPSRPSISHEAAATPEDDPLIGGGPPERGVGLAADSRGIGIRLAGVGESEPRGAADEEDANDEGGRITCSGPGEGAPFRLSAAEAAAGYLFGFSCTSLSAAAK